jgi:hypothetical protein
VPGDGTPKGMFRLSRSDLHEMEGFGSTYYAETLRRGQRSWLECRSLTADHMKPDSQCDSQAGEQSWTVTVKPREDAGRRSGNSTTNGRWQMSVDSHREVIRCLLIS